MAIVQWHKKNKEEVIEYLHSSAQGLTAEESERRLLEHGQNKLPEMKVDSLPLIFIRQFQSPLIYILFAASLIVFIMGELIDGSIILFVLFFNAIVGTIQEGKAQNTLIALKKFVETSATVLRDNKEVIIPDTQVAPGDIVILQEGEKVPADARVISSNNLSVDEAALTGESEPAHKISEALAVSDLSAAEQRNMIFKGTHVVAGNGRAIVVATGSDTIIGKISKKIAAIDTEIPLKANIRYLSRLIILAVGTVCTSLFVFGLMTGKSFREMFTTVVSLSVSVIPEGLPIVLTLVLVTGVWRMTKRNALVRKLQAVEALGQARIIAVDKTGTITKNELVIQKVFLNGIFFEVSGVGYEPTGDIYSRFPNNESKIILPVDSPELLLAGKVAAFCANAKIAFLEEAKTFKVAGDPTEAALLVFAQKVGFDKDELEESHPLLHEIPFDYKRKYHATTHRVDGVSMLTVVGAPEMVMRLSSGIQRDGKLEAFSEKDKKDALKIFHQWSSDGLRVLAFAINHNAPEIADPQNMPPLAFVGFYGMKDALRPEAKDAVARAVSAGIKVVMITGDHRITALSIAKEAGIYMEGDNILTGEEIDDFSDDALADKIDKISIFARVNPEHKLRIIQAYRKKGEIVAMTGDGVNDAPSLVAADLGVAMGKIGTEVAKEAADIVLLDDNFGSIVSAVEEGRSIYKTIKKVILYLFSTSFGEVLTIAGALALGYPLPILAAQIIWLNFVTDGFLDVSLAMEPKEEGLLKRTFERPKKYLVDSLMAQRMFIMAIPMMVGTLFLFGKYFETDIVKAWTISLTTLAVFQWFNVWNCRSEEKSIFRMNPFSNKFLVAATVTIILLQMAAVYAPMAQKILKTAPLSIFEWFAIVAVASSIILVEEIRKLFYRRRAKSCSPKYGI